MFDVNACVVFGFTVPRGVGPGVNLYFKQVNDHWPHFSPSSPNTPLPPPPIPPPLSVWCLSLWNPTPCQNQPKFVDIINIKRIKFNPKGHSATRADGVNVKWNIEIIEEEKHIKVLIMWDYNPFSFFNITSFFFLFYNTWRRRKTFWFPNESRHCLVKVKGMDQSGEERGRENKR